MKRYLEENSGLPIPGQLYFAAKQHGGTGIMGSLPFQDGVFLNGSPMDGHTAHKLLGAGYRVYLFPWEQNIQVEWMLHTGEPRAYVEEPDRPKPKAKPKRG